LSPAAVFDLDGTLIRGTSAERLLVPYLARRGLLGARQFAAALATALTIPAVGRTRALRRNKRYLAGVEVGLLHHHLPRFLTDVLEARCCPSVLKRMETLRDAGHSVYLLTGAPDFIAEALVRRFGMTGGIGTPLAVHEGRFTGRLAGTHYFGRNKVLGVGELVRRHGLDLPHSFGFADHVEDIPFLECFGHPVAVEPDAGLGRHAEGRGWEILRCTSSEP